MQLDKVVALDKCILWFWTFQPWGLTVSLSRFKCVSQCLCVKHFWWILIGQVQFRHTAEKYSTFLSFSDSEAIFSWLNFLLCLYLLIAGKALEDLWLLWCLQYLRFKQWTEFVACLIVLALFLVDHLCLWACPEHGASVFVECCVQCLLNKEVCFQM